MRLISPLRLLSNHMLHSMVSITLARCDSFKASYYSRIKRFIRSIRYIRRERFHSLIPLHSQMTLRLPLTETFWHAATRFPIPVLSVRTASFTRPPYFLVTSLHSYNALLSRGSLRSRRSPLSTHTNFALMMLTFFSHASFVMGGTFDKCDFVP